MIVVTSVVFIAILWLGFYEYVLKPGKSLQSLSQLPPSELATRIGAALILISLSILGAKGFHQSQLLRLVDVAIIGVAIWSAYNVAPDKQGQRLDPAKLRFFAKIFGAVQVFAAIVVAFPPHSG